MTVMEEILCKTREFVDAAGKKTGDLVTLGKVKMDSAKTERELERTFQEIGRMVYAQYRNDEAADDALKALFEQVDALQKNADALKDEADVLRQAKRCNDCGHVNVRAASFCQNCGKKL